MTVYASAFILFAAAPLAAALPWRRVSLTVAWACLTLGCAGIAFTAAGVLPQGVAHALVTLQLPALGGFGFEATPLNALFLLVTLAVFAAALPFVFHDAAGYAPARRSLFTGFLALTLAAMIGVFTAAGIVAFIVCWEIAAFAIWGLIGYQTRERTPVAAGLLTLSLSELGSLAGLVGLLLAAAGAGTFRLDGIAAAAPGMPPALVAAACVLTFFGFGMKAGIVPLNLWLPAAHGSAPRSISPILSGATLNLGLFAFLRIDGSLACTDVRLGLMILATGAATALVGIVYALVERDLKRLLAQSSIENIGIATAGFGAGFAFLALGHPALAGLALIAGLYHMLNHSAYKTLLFLGAGGIDASTGTHDLDRLGGLMHSLPLLATLFLFATFAIAALPPFNGFVSEWLTLESLLRVVEIGAVPVRLVFALSGAALALTAGLALTCFVMVAGSSLLGLARSKKAAAPRPAPRTVTWPMVVLTFVCLGLGVLATGVIPVLGRLAASLTGSDATAALVPAFFHHSHQLAQAIVTDLTHIGAQIGRGVLPLRGLVVLHSGGAQTPVVFAMSTGLSFAVILALLLLVWSLARLLRRRKRRVVRRTLWDAGLVHLQPEMTYTATAFAAPVRVLFERLLKPVVAEHARHHGAFVVGLILQARLVHIVDRLTLHPLIRAVKTFATVLARMHHGRVNLYAAYIAAALVVVLLASASLLN